MKKHIFPLLILTLALIFVGVNLFSTVPEAEAASSSELKEQLENLEAEKDKIEAELSELEGKLSENLDEMEKISAKVRIRSGNICFFIWSIPFLKRP